jgi:hypothetical protein
VGLRAIVRLGAQAIAANLLAEAAPRCLATAHAAAQAALDAIASPLPMKEPGLASLALLQQASERLAAVHACQVPRPSSMVAGVCGGLLECISLLSGMASSLVRHCI